MPSISSNINGVIVEFGEGVVNEVTASLVNGLTCCIRPLTKIYISAVKDHHNAPSQVNSRHNQKKAVDISRLNGIKIGVAYPANAGIKALVDAIQETFESYQGRRENFGPHMKKNGTELDRPRSS